MVLERVELFGAVCTSWVALGETLKVSPCSVFWVLATKVAVRPFVGLTVNSKRPPV